MNMVMGYELKIPSIIVVCKEKNKNYLMDSEFSTKYYMVIYSIMLVFLN